MSGKKNNRMMLILFLALAAVFVITRFTRVKNSERTLRTDIVQIDTSMVTSMILYPRSEMGDEIRFSKNGTAWSVSRDDITAPADEQSVRATLAELMNLQAEQLVARSREKWNSYQVDDSLGTRIIIMEGKKRALDLVVGRFQYEPPPQQSYNMYGQNRVSGKTYIRLWGENEVYSVDGFLAMIVNQTFNRWRNQTITRINKSQLSKIVFEYPADSGYIAEKNDAGWLVAGIMADSSSMDSYLNEISRRSHSEFADGFKAGPDPDYRITFEGDNMQSVQLNAYADQGNRVLQSSLNPGTWFSIDEDLFAEIFPAYSALLGDNE